MPEPISDKDYANQLMSEDAILKWKQRHFIALGKDVKDFIIPETGLFDGDDPDGDEDLYEMILDNTGTKALRVLAAGMHSGLTSEARPWFKLGLQNKSLMNIGSIKRYVRDIQDVVYDVLQKSNFYSAIQSVYKEEAGYGTACMLIYEDDKDIVRFYPLTFGSYRLSESYRREVNGVWRTIWMNSQQLVDKFGKESLPQFILDQLERGAMKDPFKYHEVLNVIRERSWYNPALTDSKNMPIESVYVMPDETIRGLSHIIKKTGFREWPAATPRWELAGVGPYGTGIGHAILGHVKQLQEQTNDKLLLSAKIPDPPMKAPNALKRGVNTGAGEITFGDDIEEFKPLYDVRGRLAEFQADINDTRMEILKGSYNDLFLMMADQRSGVTATEIVERHDEKLLQLGPVTERQFSELLNNVISRTTAVAYRAGLLPEPPDELIQYQEQIGGPIAMKVQYVSLLAQAQKQATVQSIRGTTAFATELAQGGMQGALDNINQDEAVREFGESIGAPPKIIRTADEVNAIREQRAEIATAQAEAQARQQAVENAQKLGSANVEGTALGEVVNAGNQETETV